MPNANRSTIAKARPTGHGQRNRDTAYAHGSNVARPEADAGVQESLLVEQRELGNNRAERRVRSAWSGKATGRDSVNATISMRMDFLVGTISGNPESAETLDGAYGKIGRRVGY